MTMTVRSNGIKIRNRKGFLVKVFCLVFFCFLIIYALHFYRKVYDFSSRKRDIVQRFNDGSNKIIMESYYNSMMLPSRALITHSPVVKLKNYIVHFDLKGMPLLPAAYEKIFTLLKSVGVTGILMEYEDMFPFEGRLKPIANKECYSPSDIKMILQFAKQSNLQVIPLVQTFGHLEYVLKLEEFASLREVFKAPQVLCPTQNGSLELVKEMLDQVMQLHPDTKYLHIGCDEVYYLGVCPRCQDRMSKKHIDEPELFIQHVKFVAGYVKQKYNVQPLMWDDEFRKIDAAVLRNYNLPQDVQIVVWNYGTEVDKHLHSAFWSGYERLGWKSAWAATAFKGANKPNSLIVNETLYLTNHYSWMNVIYEGQENINFEGIILTGWQRYDHFSVLCEIFPVAIPSLVNCMMYLNSSGLPHMDAVLHMTNSFLHCDDDNRLLCQFPGSQIYNDVMALGTLQEGLKRIKEKSLFLGWAQDVNFKLSFSNPAHLESILHEIMKLRLELERLDASIVPAMKAMFPQWSVDEWMLTHRHPLHHELVTLEQKLQKLSKITVFPVRPIELPHNLEEQMKS